MAPNRKLVQVLTAVLMPLGFVTMIGVSNAGAAIDQPGTVTCTKVTGTQSFSTALVDGGTATTQLTTVLTLKSCHASSGLSPSKGKVTTLTPFSLANNDCATYESGNPMMSSGSLKIKWSPTSEIASTTLDIPSFTVIPGGNFNFGGSNPGSVSGNGSYDGTDGFLGSSADLTYKQTIQEIAASCAGSGVSSLKVNAGTFTVG
jgi:hypothetical protein